MPPSPNDLALHLKSLHKPGHPLLLANIYDPPSARAVASLPSCAALATASYAIALTADTSDHALDLPTNLAAAMRIARIAREHGKPLTVDLQDGYGDQLAEAIAAVVALGAVGANLEDCDREGGGMYTRAEAVARIETALAVAAREGVPDFVLNARCDTLRQGGELAEVIERGRAYLDAGATSVFVWGGGERGLAGWEVVQLVRAFGGRLNVSLKIAEGNLGVGELAEMGVSRISVGPQLFEVAVEGVRREAERLLGGRGGA